MRKLALTAVLVLLASGVTGCLNRNGDKSDGTLLLNSKKSSGTTAVSSLSFSLTNAVIDSATATAPNFSIFLNANNANNLTQVCSTTDTTKACKCRFSFTQASTTGGGSISRSIDTALVAPILNFQAKCPAPSIFPTDEIPNGTPVSIKLIPDPLGGGTNLFTTNTLTFTKSTTASTGDFRDVEGRAFKNILHYSCFDKTQKQLTIGRQVKTAVTRILDNVSVQAATSNRFSAGSSAFSAQSYYFDFYVRNNEEGSINASNAGFTCPRVDVSGESRFFPLDSSFAVALLANPTFKVEVRARTVISLDSNPSPDLLGFASAPDANGVCQPFIDQNNQARPTYRLRRYVSIYPLRYNVDGSPLEESQKTNLIYVLDRPVNKTGVSGITRLGPKPCPFSFKSAQFGQKCMTDATLSGWNIDGTQITGDASCPIYPPVPDKFLKSDGTLVIRPYKPFLPRYLEDTTFKACAPISSDPVDPEIVTVHDDNIFPLVSGPNDFYCAKYYPSAGSILSAPGGDPFDKAPGDCDTAATAAAMKSDKTYACSRKFDPTSNVRDTPLAGCCQVCAGTNCTAVGGGITPVGRNAAFAPPQDVGNAAQSANLLNRGRPGTTAGSCFDPNEN